MRLVTGTSLLLGIAGGSGSGKSWLARRVQRGFSPRAVVVCQDWYYRDNSSLNREQCLRLNVDHPRAIEAALLRQHLEELLAGRAVEAPCYDYASHARLAVTRLVEPAPLIILEGLFVLQDSRLRRLMDFSVFIEAEDDVRLLRRIRRDVEERRVALAETLRLYEHCVKPMHERFVRPSSRHATWIWRQAQDSGFPQDLLGAMERALSAAQRKDAGSLPA